jgi:predicted ATPase
MYITKLNLKNFKSYIDQDFEFKNITLLTGLNGAGKSSVFQSLRMFWQQLKSGHSILNEYGELGTLKNTNVKDDSFYLTLDIEKKEALKLFHNSQSNTIGNEHSIEGFQKKVQDINFAYISANRLGPTEFQHIRNENVIINNNVGDHGEFTLDILSKYEESLMPDDFKDDVAKQNTLINHVEKWLQEISPNVKLETELNKRMNVASFSINGYTPLNVGFGISYTLSIIVQLLYSVILFKDYNLKTVLLLENPEAHLHPRGQTRIAEFIASLTNYGVQVIVETHSDYILDGLRLAVKGGKINHNDTKLYYLELDDEMNTQVKSPKIGEDGYLDEWPENFFDTSLNNKMRLM